MNARANGTLVGPIAVRAFTKRQGKGTRSAHSPGGSTRMVKRCSHSGYRRRPLTPHSVCSLGRYQYCREINGRHAAIEEGFIYADELPLEDPKGFATLRANAVRERATVAPEHSRRLRWYSRSRIH